MLLYLFYVKKTFEGRVVLLSKCVVCSTEKWRFLKEHEAIGILCVIGEISRRGLVLI